MKLLRKLAFIGSLIVFVFLMLKPSYALSLNRKVLYISSYNVNWETVPSQIRGIENALSSNVTLDMEFMNTKVVDDDESLDLFYLRIKHLFESVGGYDAVIVGDDAALDFAYSHREIGDLFYQIPIAFEGINDLEHAREYALDPYITGVVEKMDYKKTIEFAKTINPQATNLVAIVDSTDNGQAEESQFVEMMNEFKNYSYELINTSTLTESELTLKIKSLGKESLLFYQSFSDIFDDSLNKTVKLSSSEAISLICDNASIPCYRMVQAGIGSGLLGGYIVNHEESGRIAASMIMSYFNGTSFSDIPLEDTSPNTYYFDYQVMKKFNINKSDVPDGSVLINEEYGFMEQYRSYVIVSVIMAIIVIIATNFITIYIKEKKNTMKLKEVNLELQDAVSSANRANSAKGDFLSRMSHEIRTPLNAIVGITDLTKGHASDEKYVKESLEKITYSSKVLLNVINDVLDMSAIEKDKLKLNNEVFDIREMLNGITSTYYLLCKNKNLEYDMLIESLSEEKYIGDMFRVNQILNNIMSNALKFTSKGFIKVTVKQLPDNKDMSNIQFIIEDSGIGMSDEMQSRIFMPFEQANGGTARKYGGSGLGLSICQNLVTMMNGQISVSSKEGVGTKFIVTLPFAHASTVSRSEKLKVNKVLVVDDDLETLQYTSIVLDRLSLKHIECSNALDAIDILDKNKDIDMCFIDYKMPDMNGIELTRKIREKYNDDILLVIISAYDISEIEEEARLAGVSKFLTKPIFQSSVFDTLVEISGNSYVKKENTYDRDFSGKTVLLAEDNEMNYEIAKEILEMKNFKVIHANDGYEAIKLYNENPEIDIILMDIQMPNLDGYEASRQIRSNGSKRDLDIPIIAMTANAFTSDVTKALDAGMNDHLSKPINTKLLFETLEKYLDK